MNVAYVSNVVYPFVTGGAEKRIHEVGRRLVDRGHDVTVYGRHFWDGPPERTHRGMRLRAVAPARELYTDGRRSIPEAVGFAARLLCPLSRHAGTHDVVVASVFPYFPVLSSWLATLLPDTPLVTVWHECWLDHWDEYLGRLAPAGRAVERLTAAVPQRAVAVSSLTADRLARLGPSREEIAVVPNGIDADAIQAVPPAEQGFDVLYAGRLVEHKRVDVLLAAFDRIAATREVTLGIVGDGPDRERLERLAGDLTHRDRVTFTGRLDAHEDVLAEMRAARVFAAPSVREGFGITYLEAMAADCTVIGARHPESAAGEVLGDGGFLADPTVDGLEPVLTRAVDGERPPASPTEIAAGYDWDVVTDRMATVLREATD
jgi:glycosyltransferase involved in cell wall biosynthesis